MSNTKKRSKAGLVVLIILLILIGIPVTIVILLQPGTARWERITAEKTVTTEQITDQIKISNNSISLNEDWLEKRMTDGFQLINEESPDFKIMGSDLTLEKNNISLLMGAAISHPLTSKNKEIKAAVEASLSASLSNTRELNLQLESIKIGRLPIPVKLLGKVQALKSSLNTKNLLKGKEAEFNMETMSFKVNLDDLMKDISPGSRIQNFQILDKKISFSVSLSPDLNTDIKKLAAELKNIAPDIHKTIMEKLVSEKSAGLEQVNTIYTELAEQKQIDPRVTMSYQEGEVSTLAKGKELSLDFGDIVDEGSTIATSKNSYVELVLPGSSILKIFDESEVIIHSAHQIELAEGRVRALVASQDSENDEFSVQAGKTYMTVKGTDFIINYNGDVELTVLAGAVAFENRDSQVLLKENETVKAKENKKPKVLALETKKRDELLNESSVYTDRTTAERLLNYNPAPAVLKLITIYADFYFSLTPEEQDQLSIIISDYIEENPEAVRGFVLFAEEQGWIEENQTP